MPEERCYRLRKATVGLCDKGHGEKLCITVPENTAISLLGQLIGDDRLIQVVWDGRVIVLFAQDFRERAVLIE